MSGKYICPVCEFPMEDPAADFNICPSCGTEFGYNDAGVTHQELRKQWIASGKKWWSITDDPPAFWKP